MFGIGRKTSDTRRDVRDRYEPELFDNRKLNGNFSGNRDSGADVDLLADLLLQGEVNRRDTKELLTAILETQQEILKELRKQNATSVVSRAA